MTKHTSYNLLVFY